MQTTRLRSPRSAATSAFTLAEVAVTIVIIGVGLAQGLNPAQLGATHTGQVTPELALDELERLTGSYDYDNDYDDYAEEEEDSDEVESLLSRKSVHRETGTVKPRIQDAGDFYILNFGSKMGCCDEGMPLDAFVRVCQETTGINFTYEEETKTYLQSERLLMFGTKRIPKEDFYSFFQIMMIMDDIVCREEGPDHNVIRLELLRTGAIQRSRRQKGIYLKPEELDCCADKPTTLVTTVLKLPNTDVQTLSLDSDTLEIVPLGSSNSVILTGFASDVAALGRRLLSADESAEAYKSVQPVSTEGN